MAVKNLYIKNAAASGSNHGSLQDGGSLTTATTATGWTVGKLSPTVYSLQDYAVKRTTSDFGASALPSSGPDNTLGDCWRSESTLTGTFASGNWSFAVSLIAATGSTHDGRIRFRLYKGTDATGSGATQIGTGTSVLSAVTDLDSAAQNTTGTVSVASTVFSGEYLFWQFAWEHTGAGAKTAGDVLIRVDTTNSKITTTNFATTSIVSVGGASETDSGGTVTPKPGTVSVAVGVASETDAAGTVTPIATASVAVGVASETDSAGAVTPVPGAVSVSVGVASETDSGGTVTPLPGTATVAVGVASETDAAGTVTPTPGAVSVAVGVASETDAAGTVTPTPGATSVAVGVASETDSAGTVTPTAVSAFDISPSYGSGFDILLEEEEEPVAVGVASETDTAGVVTPVPGAVSVTVGVASEADTAGTVTPVPGAASVSVGVASEADSAQAVTPTPGAIAVVVGAASETDSAGAVTPTPGAISVSVGPASETDTAGTVTPVASGGAVSVGGATEADTAGTVTPVPGAVAVVVGAASETDSAGIVTPIATAMVTVGVASETDSAGAVAVVVGSVAVVVGAASETDAAGVVTPTPGAISVSVGPASETDSAGIVTPVSAGSMVAVGAASETDTAGAITPVPGSVAVVVGAASETDTAGAVAAASGSSLVAVGAATEVDTAGAITPTPGAVSVSVGVASESDTAQAIAVVATASVTVVAASETDSAGVVTPIPGAVSVLVGTAYETDLAGELEALPPDVAPARASLGSCWTDRTLLGDYRILLTTRWGGQIFRVADATCDVADSDGTYHHYSPGLISHGFSDPMPELGSTQGDLVVPVEAVLPLDVSQAVHTWGWDLGSALAELAILPEGALLEERIRLAEGTLSEPEYGEDFTPLVASIRLAASEDAGQVPSPMEALTETTFPTHMVATIAGGAIGAGYPIVVGQPGTYDTSGTIVKGTPGLVVRVDSVGHDERVLIAGHRVKALAVQVWEKGNDNSETLTVHHDYDALGQLYAYVQIYGASVITSPPPTTTYFVGWSGGGLLDPDDYTQPVRHAGDLVRWLLSKSTLPVDRFRSRVAGELLSRFRVDGYFDQSSSPCQLIQEHLTSILPVSLKTGPDGVYPAVWLLGAAEAMAVEHLQAGRGVERVGPFTLDGTREEISNCVALEYAISPETGDPQRTATLDPLAPYYTTSGALVPRVFATSSAKASALRYGRRSETIRSSFIGQDQVAPLVLESYVRWHGFLRRVFDVEVNPRYGRIRPGDVVLYSEAAAHLERQVCQVLDWSWSGAWIALRLMVVEDPVRDRRIRP